MGEYKLGEVESLFADIIWSNEPLSSGRLAQLAEARLGWKRTTTYTVLKRLCDRGIFQNQGGTVRSLISREDFQAMQSEKFVEDHFSGSLPAFLTAFGSRKKLSKDQLDQLQRIIDEMRERDHD